MTSLIQIGIPKHLIAQANLENKALELVVVDEGLLLKPQRSVREGWEESTLQGIESGLDSEAIVCEFENDWEW